MPALTVSTPYVFYTASIPLSCRLLLCRRRLGVCDVLEALLASLIRAMLSATSASVRRIGQTPSRNARVGTPVNSCEFMPVIGNLCRHAATHHAGSMHIASWNGDPRFSHEICSLHVRLQKVQASFKFLLCANIFTQPWVASGGRRYGAVGSRVGLIIQRSSVRSRLAAIHFAGSICCHLTVDPETRCSALIVFYFLPYFVLCFLPTFFGKGEGGTSNNQRSRSGLRSVTPCTSSWESWLIRPPDTREIPSSSLGEDSDCFFE